MLPSHIHTDAARCAHPGYGCTTILDYYKRDVSSVERFNDFDGNLRGELAERDGLGGGGGGGGTYMYKRGKEFCDGHEECINGDDEDLCGIGMCMWCNR